MMGLMSFELLITKFSFAGDVPVRVAICISGEEVEGLFINKTAVIPIARNNTAAAAILQFIGIIRTFLSLLYSDFLSGKEILLSDCSLVFLKISSSFFTVGFPAAKFSKRDFSFTGNSLSR